MHTLFSKLVKIPIFFLLFFFPLFIFSNSIEPPNNLPQKSNNFELKIDTESQVSLNFHAETASYTRLYIRNKKNEIVFSSGRNIEAGDNTMIFNGKFHDRGKYTATLQIGKKSTTHSFTIP